MTEKRKKPISKKIRETLWLKYNKHCAYCGCELPKLSDMQADHIKSVWRSELNFEEVDNSINNLRPACRQCNFYKSSCQVEDFRANIQGMLMNNLQKNFNYRLALKYGLVMKTVKLDKPIKFYYERFEEEQKLTEERKKYLASISKEERAIRDALDKEKLEFKDAKMELNFWGEDIHIGQVRKWVNLHKVVIKALKKQLPAPRKERTICRARLYNCFVCGSSLCNPYDNCGENYCFNCGQKLR